MKFTSRYVTTALLTSFLLSQGCILGRTSEEPAAPVGGGGSDDTGDDTGDGGDDNVATLIETDLTGSWGGEVASGQHVVSDSCTNLGSALNEAQSYYDQITFFEYSGQHLFNFNRVYYDGPDCDYIAGVGSVMDVSVSGTYAVGDLVSGTTFGITFNVSSTELRANTTSQANWLNNTGCTAGPDFTTDTGGGGAPYDSLSVLGTDCEFLSMPGAEAMSNVVSKTSSTVLKFGDFSTTSAGPGVLTGETVPTTVSSTIYFTAQ